jgi:molybdopterin synthase catalytic subunit
MITAYSTDQAIDHLVLYKAFLAREDGRSGTVVIHHGMVKKPGKQVPDFSSVELKAVKAELDTALGRIVRDFATKYELNQLLLVHRLGQISPGDSILFVIVSGVTRDRCFAACSALVDEIKKEDLIQLIEHK